jgi:hypothetical protein
MDRFSPVIALVMICAACGQSFDNRNWLGEDILKKNLEETLQNDSVHNVVDGKQEIIKSKEAAISIAEKFLFHIYGEDKIKDERPYESYKFGKYWTIKGTLPKGWDGGTFLIILDATDGKVLRITHDK